MTGKIFLFIQFFRFFENRISIFEKSNFFFEKNHFFFDFKTVFFSHHERLACGDEHAITVRILEQSSSVRRLRDSCELAHLISPHCTWTVFGLALLCGLLEHRNLNITVFWKIHQFEEMRGKN